MDPSEGLDNHSATAEVTGLESSMLARASLTVVLVTDNHPSEALGLVLTGYFGHGAELTSDNVLHLVHLAGFGVGGTNEKVVRDVVEVTAEFQPRASHRDVISCAFALGLDEHGDLFDVLSIPSSEGGELLEPLAVLVNDDIDRRSIFRGGLVSVLALVKSGGRKLVAKRVLKLNLTAVFCLDGVGGRVEAQVTSDSHGGYKLRRGHEGVGLSVSVIASSEVPVEGGDDGVPLSLLHVSAVPLADARSTGVSKHNTANLVERFDESITLDGCPHLLRARGDSELSLSLHTGISGLLGKAGCPGHILVAAVGARTNETHTEFSRPVVLLNGGLEL
mmetsp:Transcript_46906/g.120970  ORF Transcript_46906/g.120970 Transcript_46906/m.120970 type:complete len:334 (+) Transcript_46906:632-1633(+)